MGNGLAPCKSVLASAAAASVDDERVWREDTDGDLALFKLPLTQPAQATQPAVEKSLDVSPDVAVPAAASDAVAVPTAAPDCPDSVALAAVPDASADSKLAPEQAEPPLQFPTLAGACVDDDRSNASTTTPGGGGVGLPNAEAAKDAKEETNAASTLPKTARAEVDADEVLAKAAKGNKAGDSSKTEDVRDTATLSAEEKELTALLRSAVMRGEDGAAEVIRGKLKEVRSHPNYKGRLQQTATKSSTIAQATPKKKAASQEETMPEFKAPCEKTQEELDLELRQIKKKFGQNDAAAESMDMLSGMKLAKAQAAKDEAAKKKKANSSAASTSSKGSSRGRREKRPLEEWQKIPKWDPMDGRETKMMMFVSYYREQYARLKAEGKALNVATQYDPSAKQGLSITGGHQPFSRPPDNVDLPKDFRMNIGTLKKRELTKYGCESQRMLVSVHGDLFDVSDRPDKYGEDGPYWEMTGKDITWGLVCGDDSAPNYDKYYDVFKIHPEQVDGKLQGLCSWWAFYEKEYGTPVGKLDVYIEDWRLPAPPPIEESCSIM